jgi:hypothetical protein
MQYHNGIYTYISYIQGKRKGSRHSDSFHEPTHNEQTPEKGFTYLLFYMECD